MPPRCTMTRCVARSLMEAGLNAAHQVGVSRLQVAQRFLGRLQLEFVGDVQLLEDEFHHVNVVAHWFARFAEERVWPQIPRILIDQGTFSSIGGISAFVGRKN